MPRSSSTTIPFLNAAALFVFAGVLAMTVSHPQWMRDAFANFSYYIIFALTVAWGLALINLWRERNANPLLFLRSHWKGIVCSFAVASVVFISVPKSLRVLSDETNLLSVAKSMTFYKKVYNGTEGKRYYEMFWPTVASSTEKRPFLFPFFTSLVHILSGYRVANVFILNYFVLWAALFLLYMLICSYLSGLWACAGLILVTAQPVIALSAASGSFELFNLLFILASFMSLRYFLRNPGASSFMVLVLNLAMLANIRYESILFLVVTMLVLFMGGYVRLEFLAHRAGYALIPFFFLPWIWQRILMVSESDSNLSGGSWLNAFHLEHAGRNITLFFKFILDFSGQLGYAGAINLMGIAAAVYFAVLFLIKKRRRADKNQGVLLVISLVSILALFAVVILYQGGINDHPMNGRLYMPVLVILSVLPVCFFAGIAGEWDRLAIPVLVGAMVSFIYYHPIAVEDRLTNNLIINREFRYVTDFLKKNADKNALIICGRPGQVIVYNYGAISFVTANRERGVILEQYRNHLFSAIYVVQEIVYQSKSPYPDNVVDPSYHLQTVDELQTIGQHFLRISKALP